MSDQEEFPAVFSCYYGSHFDKFDGEIFYVGGENFKTMCSAATWTKYVDIFVEPDINEAETNDANRNQEEAIDDCGQYNAFIKGVRGMNFWKKSGEIELLPPKTDTTKGRKPIPKRIKERNESPQKKKKKTMDSKTNEIKVSREKRIIHCGSCGEAGHNTRSCKNVGVIPPKKSKGKTTKDGCEGPSQPTQSQVID